MITAPPADNDPILDALRAAQGRGDLPTAMSAADLRELGAQIRARSVFSARADNAHFVSRLKGLINQLTSGVVDRGEVRRVLGITLDELGYTAAQGFPGSDGQVPPAVEGTIQDLRSTRRLDLIARTQQELMAGAGQQRRGTQPERLSAFPAWELIRIRPSRVRRNWISRWQRAGGTLRNGRMVALKGDPIWGELGASGNFDDALDVDSPPFAYNSGMGWREVNAEEVGELGIKGPNGEDPDIWLSSGPQTMAGEMPKTKASMDGVDRKVLDDFLRETGALPSEQGGSGYSLTATLERSLARAQAAEEGRAS